MIRNRRLGLFYAALVLVLLSLAQVLPASSWPQLAPEDAKNIMPVSQVRRGMKGYGLTVFHGTKIEKFDVEILGVLKKANLGKDLILFRAAGGPMTTRDTGIIAGMSGSPVYIDGKVVGAVAYGSQFAKEPVGMLTPIADMLEAWDTNLPKQASGYSSVQPLSQPVSVDGKVASSVSIDADGAHSAAVDKGVLYMQPLMTPLMVSGMSPRGIAALADILRPYGIQPTAGPGGGESVQGLDVDLVPGAAIGMSLASGDIDMTGIGTVTYRRGERLVAFGHPMLSIGAVDAPMTTAYVDDVLSSYQVSTKMASPIRTVGRIFQDRPWCIAGRMSDKAATIPVTVDVDDQSTHRARTYKIDVINHPLLASRLITLVVGEAIFETHPTPGDSTANVSYEVVADQVGKITRSNVFFDPVSVDSASVTDIGSLLQILSSNRFYPLDIRSVNVKVRIVDKRDTATIDRIFVKEGEFEPGETVDVGVVLRPYKKDRVTKTLSIKIPATAPDGKLLLTVRGGATTGSPAAMMASMSGPDDGSGDGDIISGGSSGMANVDNVKQLVDKYLEKERNNQVVVQMLMRSTAVNVAGEKLAGLPASIADVMKSSRNSGLKLEREEVKQVFDQDLIVFGMQRLTINVKKKDLNESKSGSKSDSSPSSSDSGDMDSSSSPDDGTVVMYNSGFGSGAKVALAASDDDAPSAEVDEDVVVDESAASDDSSTDKAPASTDASSGKTDKTDKSTASDVKTVVRQAKTWLQKSQADFSKGTFSGVSASSDDKLQIVPTLQKLVETPDQFVWCMALAKDGVYAGTGDSGKIYHITADGKSTLFYDTGELEVQALAVDANGNVYAGTSPKGRIFKIAPDGSGKLLYQAPERYVLALALDPDGNLYAGVGDAGNIYRIAPDGTAGRFAELTEQQVLSLSWDPKGSLLVGTGINGIVYRIDKYGVSAPIFDAAETSITSVLADSKGNVYAGTSPKGVVYRISPDGRSKSVFSKAARVLSMAIDRQDNVYAVSDGTVARISPDDTVITLDSSKNKVQFLSLAYDDSSKTLYAGTGNIGMVYVSKCCDLTGTFESPVHDTSMISRWGRIKWVANVPEGASVEIRTRTGNVDTPDATWSDWSPAYTNSAGEQIAGDNARYIEYQVTLKAGKNGESPSVSTVAISYLTPNQAPTVKITAPVAGDVWSGKETIKWIGTDPDKDTLTYDVYYSKDGGKTWESLVGGVSAGAAKATEQEIIKKVKTELEKSPDVPEDMKKKVLDEPQKPAGASATASSNSPAKPVTNTSHSWDTKSTEDGNYLIKVVASDRISNATGALTDETVSEPFTICNGAPKLTLYRSGVDLKAVGSASISGSALSKLVEIVGVQYRIDGGTWTAASANDGMFDSPYEGFTVTTPDLTTGTHKVEVQAVDAAGNAASGTVEVKVS